MGCSAEDKCADCDIHAHCETDHCVCDSGFKGSGAKGDCFIVGGELRERTEVLEVFIPYFL